MEAKGIPNIQGMHLVHDCCVSWASTRGNRNLGREEGAPRRRWYGFYREPNLEERRRLFPSILEGFLPFFELIASPWDIVYVSMEDSAAKSSGGASSDSL